MDIISDGIRLYKGEDDAETNGLEGQVDDHYYKDSSLTSGTFYSEKKSLTESPWGTAGTVSIECEEAQSFCFDRIRR